ncbi:MAG: recombinase family protein [Defluviitaleaceae bacterium]|nr:recombinase family protein [Defluviitaleaceae bacterium]
MNALRMSDMEQHKTATKPTKGIKKKSHEEYNAALYVRISRDEGNNENVSLGYQEEMLRAYALEHGYNVHDVYIDNGESGTTFNRKDFQRMIDDIESGLVNMVLTKDLSRFGRNLSQAVHYRDDYFPKNGVRFISIDGKFDSERDAENDFAVLEDLFNEFYPRQVSRKVKATRKVAAERGQFMGSIPPYGYRRDPENKHKLVIDEEVAHIVKRIYEQFLKGDSARRIGDMLNRDGILPPQAHYWQYSNKRNPFEQNAKSWCSSTVLSILQRDVYIGNITQGKRTTFSYKDDTLVYLPPEDWVRVENMHDSIIDRDIFDAVQVLISTNKKGRQRRTKDGEVSLFSNLIRCTNCGSKLTMHSQTRRGKTQRRYRCSRYAQHASKGCTPHQIDLEILNSAVLDDIQRNARLAKEDEDAFVKALYQASRKEQAAEVQRCKKELDTVKARLDEIDRLVMAAYEDRAKGNLPESMLSKLFKGYAVEQTELEAKLPILTATLESASSQIADLSAELETLKQHAEITELTREIVTSLIRVINVHEPKQNGKQREYDIEIRYRFQPPQPVSKPVTKKDTISPNTVSSETALLSNP